MAKIKDLSLKISLTAERRNRTRMTVEARLHLLPTIAARWISPLFLPEVNQGGPQGSQIAAVVQQKRGTGSE